MAFKVLCVDHVGVAVNDLELIKKQMKDLLNLEPSMPDETVEEQHVTTSFFKPSAQSEACELEFLGSTTPDGPPGRSVSSSRRPVAFGCINAMWQPPAPTLQCLSSFASSGSAASASTILSTRRATCWKPFLPPFFAI